MNDDIERADSKSPSFKSRSTFMDDESMLLQALDSVGASAYGIICISVWILNEGSSQLIQPRNGFWVDPIFRRENRSDALEMLLDERRIDYAPARHLVPGEGVEGLLFSESLNTIRVRTSHIKRSSILRTDHEATDRSFAFRSLKPILDDEDQPYNRRLSLMIEAKIGKAIGFPFHHNSTKGIVVYMARETAREENLLSTVCIRYLLHSTQFISGLLVFLSTRRDSQKQIQEHLMGVYDRIRRKLLAVHHMKNYPLLHKSSIDHCEESPTNKIEKHTWIRNFFQHDCVRRTLEQVHAWFQKCKGGNVPLSPPKSWASLRFTFCAVYIQLFVLYWVDDFIVKQSHGRFSLQRGTLGSNVSSLFSLTASPASQPRPLIIGQIICVGISILLKYFKVIPRILRVTFCGALSTTVLARLGLTTPSATALSISFSYDNATTFRSAWVALAILCCQTIMSILLATALNNISSKRQYPTSWMLARR